jgi:hypothetical protein
VLGKLTAAARKPRNIESRLVLVQKIVQEGPTFQILLKQRDANMCVPCHMAFVSYRFELDID